MYYLVIFLFVYVDKVNIGGCEVKKKKFDNFNF